MVTTSWAPEFGQRKNEGVEMKEVEHVEDLRKELKSICDGAELFFINADATATTLNRTTGQEHYRYDDWNLLPDEQKQTAQQLRTRLTRFGVQLLGAMKTSALLEQIDEIQTRRIIKEMAASLSLKHFEYHDARVISLEEAHYGMMPSEQVENFTIVGTAKAQWQGAVERLSEKIDLIAPSKEHLSTAIVASQAPGISKYRANTAFIMMQIDERNAELEDVKNAMKNVFKEFGIKAVRSDEIEHSDVATERILNEIATSEFLIADLTGERPSVYYELGYAHALNKRPILYRKQGTKLHFDISVHNCPEYKNITDLTARLRKRLADMLGREPKGERDTHETAAR